MINMFIYKHKILMKAHKKQKIIWLPVEVLNKNKHFEEQVKLDKNRAITNRAMRLQLQSKPSYILFNARQHKSFPGKII